MCSIYIRYVYLSILMHLFPCLVLTKVSWGTLRVKGSDNRLKAIDFLTSTYGGRVPDSALRAVRAVPADACSALALAQMRHFRPGYAVIVDRGQCPFGEKTLHAQRAGAALVLVVDRNDSALQRLGAVHPTAGYIAIPALMIPLDGADYLLAEIDKSISRISSSSSSAEACASPGGEQGTDGVDLCSGTGSGTGPGTGPEAAGSVSIDVVGAADASLSGDWVDVALTEFAAGAEDKRHQLEGLIEKYSGKHGIVAWLRRQL
jgi:hypothetical protein